MVRLRARYEILHDSPKYLILRDVGPWEVYPTITNDAEQVYADLQARLGDRRLFYLDSEADLAELVMGNRRLALVPVVMGSHLANYLKGAR